MDKSCEQQLKTCIRCKRALPLNAFTKNKRSKDGKNSYCIDCISEKRVTSGVRFRKRTIEEVSYDIETQSKNCSICGKRKPFGEFHTFKPARDGRTIYCKSCERVRRYRRNIEVYGLTVEEYEERLKNQGGSCAICGKQFISEEGKRRPHVDHNHTTGKVRGILCSLCNTAIGALQENESIILKAAEYVHNDGVNYVWH